MQQSASICTVFAHGIIDSPSQINRFQEAIATSEAFAVTFPDAMPAQGYDFNHCIGATCNLFGKKVNRNAMFMGQKDDIEALYKYMQTLSSYQKVILYGCSRGSATILSYLAQHNPNNIQAVILDACPANIPDTIQLNLAKIGINPLSAPYVFNYLFPQYNHQEALTPHAAVSKITNKNLPILLIHSATDSVVHISNTIKLYQEFCKAGFTNVYLYVLPHGRHSFLLQDETMKPLYLEAVHSFYKKFNVPYNNSYALKDLEKSNISIEQMNAIVAQYQEQIETVYNQSYKRNLYISTATLLLLVFAYSILRTK